MKQVVVNGLNIDISSTKVVIHDVEGDLTKREAVKILKYLQSEGFLREEKIILEIVSSEEDNN